MKHIKFIRHNRLSAPYDDYSRLTFEEICDLATHKIDPPIQRVTQSTIATQLAEIRPTVILCSDSIRAIQTAAAIAKYIGKQTRVIQSQNLREIYFDPSKLLTKEEYGKAGMQAIRSALFIGMTTGHGAESVEKIFARIEGLKKDIDNVKDENILCVTHSFYMRVLRLYFLEKITVPEKLTSDLLTRTVDHTYLDGFQFNI